MTKNTKVFLHPAPNKFGPNNGVGRVLLAQHKYLPEFGISLVTDPAQADVIAAHIDGSELPRVDVLHCHGLYWSDIPHEPYNRSHFDANRRIAASTRRARMTTVPSEWVAYPFRRDMRLDPFVIGHGIDFEEWQGGEPGGYILWNKNRADDVCNPAPALALARAGYSVVSTFAPPGESHPNLRVIGPQSYEAMQGWIRGASIYLATTPETFGIGTLEAMAAGVPVLGWKWGATPELIEHQGTGYLVERGDYAGLVEGVGWIAEHYKELSEYAPTVAMLYDWSNIIAGYADIYHELGRNPDAPMPWTGRPMYQPPEGTAVVIPCHNYARYVGAAIESVLEQSLPALEIVVVDDGSTDNSLEIIERYSDHIEIIRQPNQGVAAARNNGVRATVAPYIVCLDADDRLHPDYIKTLQPVLASDRGLGIVYSGLVMFRDDGSTQPSRWPPEFNWEVQARPNVPPENCIPSAAMFRREMFRRSGGYRQRYAPAEDAEFWTRGLSLGFDARRVTNEPLFHYRVHGQGAHLRLPYTPIDDYHPWMHDKEYPLAAPAQEGRAVRSYHLPGVSVIIPVGPGHADFVAAAIETVIGQTYREWELIVVLDNWRDGEYEEYVGLEADYPFINWRFTGSETGAGAARNVGLEAARAPLVFFLDADDWLMPDALGKMLSAFERSGRKRYVYSDWWTDKGQKHETRDYSQVEWKGQHAITCLIPTEWARDVGGFDAELEGWEDWDFFLKLATGGYCGTRVPEPLFVYRYGSGERRERSHDQANPLLSELKTRYNRYYEGGEPMPACGSCGEAAKLLNRWQYDGISNFSARMVAGEGMTMANGSGAVRMEFVGPQVGSRKFKSKQDGSRVYVGGNNGIDRYANIHPDDVGQLEASGLWKRVMAQSPNDPTRRTGRLDADRMAEQAAIQQREAQTAALLGQAQGVPIVPGVTDAPTVPLGPLGNIPITEAVPAPADLETPIPADLAPLKPGFPTIQEIAGLNVLEYQVFLKDNRGELLEEDLDKLEAAELEGKGRSTVLTALYTERDRLERERTAETV